MKILKSVAKNKIEINLVTLVHSWCSLWLKNIFSIFEKILTKTE